MGRKRKAPSGHDIKKAEARRRVLWAESDLVARIEAGESSTIDEARAVLREAKASELALRQRGRPMTAFRAEQIVAGAGISAPEPAEGVWHPGAADGPALACLRRDVMTFAWGLGYAFMAFPDLHCEGTIPLESRENVDLGAGPFAASLTVSVGPLPSVKDYRTLLARLKEGRQVQGGDLLCGAAECGNEVDSRLGGFCSETCREAAARDQDRPAATRRARSSRARKAAEVDEVLWLAGERRRRRLRATGREPSGRNRTKTERLGDRAVSSSVIDDADGPDHDDI